MSDDDKQDIALLRQTVLSVRAESFPMVPAGLVMRIIELEVEHEESPERAVPGIEEAISSASSGQR